MLLKSGTECDLVSNSLFFPFSFCLFHTLDFISLLSLYLFLSLSWGATDSVCLDRPREMFSPSCISHSMSLTVKTFNNSLYLVASNLSLT